ncbi:MFS transporter [Streptomyces tirandamycinicus]|uniref:MFS transporter n=1 Tax=Streptomyces tirandamycinicus TaxID=2174846 RepID=UPI00343BF705
MAHEPQALDRATSEEGAEAQRVHARRWLVLALVCSGLLLVAMDATVLNVALPSIAQALGPSSVQLLWIIDLYSLVVAALLVFAGSLSDRFGRRRMFVIGLVLFGLASFPAAYADSAELLIASRALRGVGGALIMPATLSIIRNVFTSTRERWLAIAIWSSTASAGTALGPILAGILLERYWWGSVFLLTIPPVIIALVGTALWVPESRDPNPGSIDVLSALLSVVGMLGIVYGIKELAKYGFGDGMAASVGLLGLVAMAAFVARQRRLAYPMIDLTLFRTWRFSTSALAVMLSFFGFFALLFFITQYFQLVRGLSPLETGVRLLPLAVASAVAAPLTGSFVRRLGTRVTLSGGFLTIAFAMALFATLGGGSGELLIAAGLVLMGFGASVTVTAGSQAIMGSAPADRAGGAAAVQETSFELGAGLGVALMGSLMGAVYSRSLPDVSGVSASVLDTARESLPTAADQAARLGEAGERLFAAAKEAFFDGFGVTMLAGVAVMLATALLAFLYLPNRTAEAAEGPGSSEW